MPYPQTLQRVLQRMQSRLLATLVFIFLVAGIAHFVVTGAFERIVPPWIPQPRLVVYVSGVAEILGAIGLLVPRVRVFAAWGLIALLLAVFPANIHMLQLARDSHANAAYQAVLWIRLPLQPLLIWLVWRVAIRHPAPLVQRS